MPAYKVGPEAFKATYPPELQPHILALGVLRLKAPLELHLGLRA
jgi:hypothetical protein